MKKLPCTAIIMFCLYCCGCSMPTAARHSQIFSFTKTETKTKGLFSSGKSISITGFRGNESMDMDITALKKRVEKFIAAHPDLSEAAKANLLELKVTLGATKEEVKLLLDEPDKVILKYDPAHDANETWAYQREKMNAFTILIIPVWLSHESYRLYFKAGLLKEIEWHYIKQVIKEGSPVTTFDKH